MVDPDKLIVTVVNTTAFFFHGWFDDTKALFPGRMLHTRVSQKSCRIQPIKMTTLKTRCVPYGSDVCGWD